MSKAAQATKKIRVRMEVTCIVDHEFETTADDAAELTRLAKTGLWNTIGERFDDIMYVKDSRVDTDSIMLVVDGKQIYQD